MSLLSVKKFGVKTLLISVIMLDAMSGIMSYAMSGRMSVAM